MFRYVLAIPVVVLSAAAGRAAEPDLSQVANQIVERTNEFRKQEKRGPLTVNANLKDAAEYFAKFMASTDKYGHHADGNTPAERAKAKGYNYCIVLENIAYAYNSAGFTTEALTDQFANGWKESPGHRKNMLDPDVTETGVAVARGEKSGYYYAVQMFGRPKSMAIEFRIVNQTDGPVNYTIGGEEYRVAPRYIQTHNICRPGKLAFEAPKGLESVPVKDGAKYVVTGSSGSYQLKKE